jgi:hypothetical protein
MNLRRLVCGLSVLLLVTGALLACFTPGGLFNDGGRETITTPIGSFSFQGESRSSAGPIVGYVLCGMGAVGLVVAFAMKSPPST